MGLCSIPFCREHRILEITIINRTLFNFLNEGTGKTINPTSSEKINWDGRSFDLVLEAPVNIHPEQRFQRFKLRPYPNNEMDNDPHVLSINNSIEIPISAPNFQREHTFKGNTYNFILTVDKSRTNLRLKIDAEKRREKRFHSEIRRHHSIWSRSSSSSKHKQTVRHKKEDTVLVILDLKHPNSSEEIFRKYLDNYGIWPGKVFLLISELKTLIRRYENRKRFLEIELDLVRHNIRNYHNTV